MKLLSLFCALALLPVPVIAQDRSPSRRSNEAAVIEICRKFVQAQLQHAQRDRDEDTIREYAQAFLRSKQQPDGLYDLAAPGARMNSLWARLEQARPRGYFARRGRSQTPHCGYWFAILKSQGGNAVGGYRDYMVGTHLAGGFALIAWPAKYGESGNQTFVVNQSGRILQKDLGPDTARLATKITSYDPDASWTPALTNSAP